VSLFRLLWLISANCLEIKESIKGKTYIPKSKQRSKSKDSFMLTSWGVWRLGQSQCLKIMTLKSTHWKVCISSSKKIGSSSFLKTFTLIDFKNSCNRIWPRIKKETKNWYRCFKISKIVSRLKIKALYQRLVTYFKGLRYWLQPSFKIDFNKRKRQWKTC
jgi:hypothetical protein